MGQTFTRARRRLKSKKIVVFGPQGSGKTTLVAGLKHGFFVNTAPTVSFACTSIPGKKLGSLGFTIFDLGGSSRNQILWPNFYLQTHALLWVSKGSGDLEEDMHTLQEILEKEMILAGLPLLIILNTDVPSDPTGVASHLEVGDRPTRVLCADVRTDFDKIWGGLLWLEKESNQS